MLTSHPCLIHLSDNVQKGPVEVDELKTLWASKAIDAKTLVWTAGMPGWTELGQLQELLAQLTTVAARAPAPVSVLHVFQPY